MNGGMKELDTITIKGFKSIASIEKLKLGAINVVIGPNGSGKADSSKKNRGTAGLTGVGIPTILRP